MGGSIRVPLSPLSYCFLGESWKLEVEKRPGAKSVDQESRLAGHPRLCIGSMVSWGGGTHGVLYQQGLASSSPSPGEP